MKELVKVEINKNQEPVISGRELHEKLGVNTRYNDWIVRMFDYGFEENKDFQAITQKRVTAQGNETTYNDHIIKLDMAKEICMLQRTEKGKQFRQYFIQVEKKLKEKIKETAGLTDMNNETKMIATKNVIKALDEIPFIYERNDRIDYTETTRTTPNGTVVKTTRISLYPKHDENRVYNLHPDKLIFM